MGSGLLRAAHVQEDAPPWILEDTLSASLIDERQRTRLESSMAEWAPEVRQAWRVAHAVRSRLAEDVAVEGLSTGYSDYVLLGAGLDTFAWRHPRAAEFSVHELDHPDTQAWKRAALERVRLPEPDNVRFVPVDLSTTALDEIDTPSHATWNWLGMTMYLPRPTTEATLRRIASHAPGTTLVVNFVLPPDELDELAAAVSASGTAAVVDADEPVLATYTADDAETMLREAGFGMVSMLSNNDLTRLYLRSHPDLTLSGSTVIAVATVSSGTPLPRAPY
jgi:methyltransferase (TIGR00027 family)